MFDNGEVSGVDGGDDEGDEGVATVVLGVREDYEFGTAKGVLWLVSESSRVTIQGESLGI